MTLKWPKLKRGQEGPHPDVARAMIEEALSRAEGSAKEAAVEMGLSRMSFYRIAKRYGISFRTSEEEKVLKEENRKLMETAREVACLTTEGEVRTRTEELIHETYEIASRYIERILEIRKSGK